MTEQEFFQKMSAFHAKEVKRSLISNDEFSQKEFFDFYKEKKGFNKRIQPPEAT